MGQSKRVDFELKKPCIKAWTFDIGLFWMKMGELAFSSRPPTFASSPLSLTPAFCTSSGVRGFISLGLPFGVGAAGKAHAHFIISDRGTGLLVFGQKRNIVILGEGVAVGLTVGNNHGITSVTVPILWSISA